MVKSSLTTTRPALSIGTPSVLPSGEEALPAAQITVRAGMNCPPLISTPPAVTFVTCTPSWTSTPMSSNCRLPLAARSAGYAPRMCGAPSMTITFARAS